MGICGITFVYAIVLMIGPVTFGTVMCYPSPTAYQIQAAHNLASDSLLWAFYNSVTSLFAIAGPFVVTGLLKVFNTSRKKTVFVVALFGAIFWFLNLLTKVNIWAGIIIRAFQGIVIGAYSSISPMYLVEIAPEGTSGFYGSLNQIAIVIGFLLFDFIGPSLTYLELDYVGGAICALQAIFIWFIIESPAVTNKQTQKDNEKDEDDAKHEPLCKGKNLCGLLTGIALMVFQQFVGINAILTNLADLMNASGLDMDGNYQSGIATLAQFVAVVVGGILMDKLGRRLIWIVSNGIIAVFLLIFALNDKYQWSNVLPLVCIFLYQLGFGLGVGPIPWFIIPEYFDDPKVRALATTIVSASNWIFSFAVIFLWPVMKSGMKMFGSLIFYMVIAVISLIFGLFFVHEPIHEAAHADEKEDSSDSDRPEAL